MIKKNTKVIFEDKEETASEELVGGIPLSVGELIKVHKNAKVIEYIVKDKKVDCFMDGKDQEINITYVLKRKS